MTLPIQEVWRDIPNIPDYQASTFGRIRSLHRSVRCKGGTRAVRGMVLKAFISKATGYYQVAIRSKRYSVHRLVASTWCAGHFDGAVVDHINGKRDDNSYWNLRWVTVSENAKHGFELGRANPLLGRFSSDHPTAKAVISTEIATGVERYFAAGMDAVRDGFDSSSISRCCNGINKSHKGFRWRWARDEHGVKWSHGEEIAA